MQQRLITAADMAREAGIDSKEFRRQLRMAGLNWHVHNARWAVAEDSPQHHDMRRVLSAITRG